VPWIFTYEKGDVIGGFVVKIAAALTAQGILTSSPSNHGNADFFWHSAYRPNAFKPDVQPNQSVFYNLENVRINPSNGETVLQTRLPEDDQLYERGLVYVPWAWVSFEERYSIPDPRALLRDSSTFDAQAVLKRKTRFCSFMASFCSYESVYMQIYGPQWKGFKQPRTKFYEMLNTSYKPVDALGRCHHNTEQPPQPSLAPGQRWSGHDQSIWMMRSYKFAMCWENMPTPGYFTEKLFNAYLAETVPIYWGDPQVDELVNVEAFVWCRPREPWSKCMDQIRELDKNDELYMQKLRTPILKDNRIPDWMNYTVLALKLARLWKLKEKMKS